MKLLNKKSFVGLIAALAVGAGGLGVAGTAYAADANVTLTNPTESKITLENVQKGHMYLIYKIGNYVSATDDSKTAATNDLSSIGMKGVTDADVHTGQPGNPDSPTAQDINKALYNAMVQAGIPTTAAYEAAHDYAPDVAEISTLSPEIRKFADALTFILQPREGGAISAVDTVTTPDKDQPMASTSKEITVRRGEGWYFIVDQASKANNPIDGEKFWGTGVLVGTPLTGKVGAESRTYTVLNNYNQDGSKTEQTLGTVDAKTDDTNTPGLPEDGKKTAEGSYSNGGTVVFTLESSIPDIEGRGFTSYSYKFTDTLGPGFNTPIKVKSITATFSDGTKADITSSVPATPISSTATGSVIEFDFTQLVNPAGKEASVAYKYSQAKLSVVYEATVKDGATLAQLKNSFVIDDNGHKIPITPVDPNTPGTVIKETEYGDFKKTTANGTTGLAGAKFELLASDGITRVATATSLTDDPSAAADETGIVKFGNLAGLEEGEVYTIHEIEAPADYMLQELKFSMKVQASVLETDNSGVPTKVSWTVDYIDDGKNDPFDLVTDLFADPTQTDPKAIGATVKNVQSIAQLPLTGAAGVILFLVVGALLGGGSLTLVMMAKRNKKAALMV